MKNTDNTDSLSLPTEEPKKKKRKITKEELERLLKLRKSLIKKNGKYFASISKDADAEFQNFQPCEKCKFIKSNCYKTCGVAIKWLYKSGKLEYAPQYGNGTKRVVSEQEYLDTTGVNLGLSEEVDKNIADELNNDVFAAANESLSMNEINSYEVED